MEAKKTQGPRDASDNFGWAGAGVANVYSTSGSRHSPSYHVHVWRCKPIYRIDSLSLLQGAANVCQPFHTASWRISWTEGSKALEPSNLADPRGFKKTIRLRVSTQMPVATSWQVILANQQLWTRSLATPQPASVKIAFVVENENELYVSDVLGGALEMTISAVAQYSS